MTYIPSKGDIAYLYLRNSDHPVIALFMPIGVGGDSQGWRTEDNVIYASNSGAVEKIVRVTRPAPPAHGTTSTGEKPESKGTDVLGMIDAMLNLAGIKTEPKSSKPGDDVWKLLTDIVVSVAKPEQPKMKVDHEPTKIGSIVVVGPTNAAYMLADEGWIDLTNATAPAKLWNDFQYDVTKIIKE